MFSGKEERGSFSQSSFSSGSGSPPLNPSHARLLAINNYVDALTAKNSFVWNIVNYLDIPSASVLMRTGKALYKSSNFELWRNERTRLVPYIEGNERFKLRYHWRTTPLPVYPTVFAVTNLDYREDWDNVSLRDRILKTKVTHPDSVLRTFEEMLYGAYLKVHNSDDSHSDSPVNIRLLPIPLLSGNLSQEGTFGPPLRVEDITKMSARELKRRDGIAFGMDDSDTPSYNMLFPVYVFTNARGLEKKAIHVSNAYAYTQCRVYIDYVGQHITLSNILALLSRGKGISEFFQVSDLFHGLQQRYPSRENYFRKLDTLEFNIRSLKNSFENLARAQREEVAARIATATQLRNAAKQASAEASNAFHLLASKPLHLQNFEEKNQAEQKNLAALRLYMEIDAKLMSMIRDAQWDVETTGYNAQSKFKLFEKIELALAFLKTQPPPTFDDDAPNFRPTLEGPPSPKKPRI